MNWPVIAAVLSSGGVAGIIGSLLTGLLNRPKVRADAVSMLTDSALKQVNELQERTAEAEREATGARNDLVKARQQIRELTHDIDAMVATMRLWQAAILSPAAELEHLRDMVRAGTGTNINGRRI